MFTCVWQLCGWVDPTRMENKKGIFQSQHNNLPQNNEASKIETFVKHPHNQNSTDHGQRNVQYSLKQPNYLIQQINPNFHNLQYENQYKVYQTPENFKGINVAQSFHVQNYTQYEKNAQSQVHRTTHVPPQSSLANNIIVQNTPQIWVPQQPITIPYQPQPAQKPEYQKVSSPSTPQNQGKSNTDKKKAVGSSQLKSPSAKRPPEAPVTKQGWLHKQGSEGLMLWKKRWFVLVEYCLFYYKGPEEEKLLGSILLPSYKVSICKPEEKISKKYAFKCEHANMRTYILATDSQEQMMHWVTVMNLATLMQKNSELPKPSCGYNITYESGEQQYPKNSLNPPTPINTHSPSNSLLQDQCAYNQPLYANAPPKPRRLNDGFSSPSPDILDRQNVQYIEPRNLSRSPNSSYCKNLSYNSKHSRESLIEFQRIHDVERRTPETYGRSSNRPTDYEDIYAEETMYKRPLSPVAYNHVIKRNNPTAAYPPHRYTPVNMNGPAETMQYPVPQMRKNPSLNIARPHSADFLEYELNHKLEDCVNIQQRPRPKSSLEINSNDNDFYSRERYAEKMRKSVQYLKHVPPKYAPNEAPICTGYENVSPFVAAHSHFLNVNKSQMSHIQKPQPMRSKSALSEGKGVCGSSSETRYLEREMINPDFSKQYYGGGGSRYRNQEFDQFTRSASARLAHQGERISVESRMINRDGERKREESMRRLLEWKQRMLQSPLNRKIQGNVACRGKTDIYNNNEMGYKISKHPKYNEAYIDDFHSKSSTQYNSYSSDDEENKKSSKKIVQTQAGGTSDTFASNCESPTPAQPLSTTVLSTSTDPAKPTFHFNLHETPYSNVIEKLLVSTCQDGFQKPLKTFSKKDLDQLSNLSSELAEQIANSESKSVLNNSDMNKNDNEENIAAEENYIPMSPSKRISALGVGYDSIIQSLGDNVKMDENHYVEMTQNAVGSFLFSSFNPGQNGEQNMQVFNDDNKLEPLYVELTSPEPEPTNEDDFPEILITPDVKIVPKSDSSDADDEASKDLDSLDTPSQPRFSLSDTFRPASYYLGTSQANVDFQDSSDSELVSPPPIPSSPPPLDDINSLTDTYISLKIKDEENSDNKTRSSNYTLNAYSKKGKDGRKKCEKDDDNDTFQSFKLEENCSIKSGDTNTSLYKEKGATQEDFHEYENLLLSQYEDDTNSPITNRKLVEDDKDFPDVELHELCALETSCTEIFENPTRSASVTNDPDSIPISNTLSSISAPYYYSDLSITMTDSQSSLLTLNNQRSTLKCKRDITHIRNPIKCNVRDTSESDDNTSFKLAAEARSASADFLNLTDKPGHIDNKNIYESNSVQRIIRKDNNAGFPARNLLSFKENDKFTSASASPSVSTDVTVRRTHSLEGLLENVLKDGSVTSLLGDNKENVSKTTENASEGSYLWEEDSIWRERLRSASQRHTKSMEDLDTIGEGDIKRKFKSPRGITRGVTYVNENYMKLEKHQTEPESSKTIKGGGDSKIKKDGSFILDREKLRQWDLMSSAPSDNQLSSTAVASQVQDGNNVVVEMSDGNLQYDTTEIATDAQTASGSISINPRDSSQLSTFPRAISAQKAWIPSNLPMESVHSVTNLSRNCEKEFSSPNQRVYYSNQSSSHPNLTPARKENWPVNEKVSVSAGELLGRTHEELVLLLIQLRRQSSQTLQAIENCYNEFDMIQAQLYAMDQTRRMENLQKLEQIKQHLLELEKQYEKGKPLVNLVDNMVKLGSLYRVPQERTNISHHIIKDRIEFNQQIQERRLLADEKREWNRLNTTNHFQLQEKVQQLYMLDRLIHEESGTLQNLQQDKEDIERALGGLRHRLSKGFKDPSEIEIARKQQIMLENELIRVHFMLAQNSKKLEETVSGNAKLEQELMVLKQKLQSATLQTSSQYLSNPSGDSLTCTAGNSPELESDLHKVKKNIGELQQQRHKLSLQVRQLTDRSSNTSQTKCQPPNDNSMINKKRIQSLWRETDLDTMSITDHGEYDSNFSHRIKSTPLYINTNYRHEDYDFYQDNNSTGDNSVMSSNTPQEKQEIKTVRIVKRESEKRQRDREKCLPTGKWDAVQEENTSSDNCNIFKQPPPPPPPPPPSHIVHHSTPSLVSSSEDINGLVTNNSVSSPNLCDFEEKQEAHLCTISNGKSHDITPVFKSEAARQIITEMAIHQPPKQSNRRVVPKEKRRHYTAPHDQSILQSMQQLPTDIDSFDKHGVNSRRARDDLDMERALRQRIDAPDVVRSTLINTELKYNERTIDDLLGTPSKINIPERYIPEQLPQLSVEEQEYRLRKVESIKKMLSDTTFISTSSTNLNAEGQETDKTPTKVVNKATSIYDEKKQREHLLQLNQILAKQVMEMSKIVAEKATARLSNQKDQTSAEEDDLSPLTPLPLYQQRDNFYT